MQTWRSARSLATWGRPLWWTAIILGSYLLYVYGVAGPAAPDALQPQCELAVLADASDPYYALAQEIAAAENAPLAHSLPEVMACPPAYLLWVVSPVFLSDAALIELGLALQEEQLATAPGIITASTLEGARDLWQRRWQIRGERFAAVNAPNPAAHIEVGRIFIFPDQPNTPQPLTRSSFRAALSSVDYLSFTGHGASGYLRLDEDTTIRRYDLPALQALVIETGSCQSLRPWIDNSIALAFVDQGAAVYTGFVFSPNEGYLIGEFDGLPLRYTWQDFPIGQVVQVQIRGTLQGFASLPYLFLLGDPRSTLHSAPPYKLVEDRQEKGQRTLIFENVPAGAIPIRVEDGAAYRFVEVVGYTAASERDPFYNSRVQMINQGKDKLILLVQPGGDLTLRLWEHIPWYWLPGDILVDGLDHTFIFSQQSDGDLFSLGFAVVPAIWVVWQVFKKRLSRRKLGLALLLGLGTAILQGGYVLARLDELTITSKAVVLSPLSLAAAFVLSFCGSLMYFQARTNRGRSAALLVITFTSWATCLGGLLLLAAYNSIAFIPRFGVALYSYSLGLLPAGAFWLTLTLAGLGLGMVARVVEASPLPPLY